MVYVFGDRKQLINWCVENISKGEISMILLGISTDDEIPTKVRRRLVIPAEIYVWNLDGSLYQHYEGGVKEAAKDLGTTRPVLYNAISNSRVFRERFMVSYSHLFPGNKHYKHPISKPKEGKMLELETLMLT